MLNRIIWNRTTWHLTVCKQKTYLYLFEIELFWYLAVCKKIYTNIKMFEIELFSTLNCFDI